MREKFVPETAHTKKMEIDTKKMPVCDYFQYPDTIFIYLKV